MVLIGLTRVLRRAVSVGHAEVFGTKHAWMVAGVLAFALCAASSIRADTTGPLEITLDNISNGDGTWQPPFTNPNAASGGALWIAKQSSGANSSSSPNGPVLLDQNVNIDIAADIPSQGWFTIAQALVSQGTAAGDITLNDFGPPSDYGGYFTVDDGGPYTSSTVYTSNPGTIALEIWAWTGTANDPATAAASGNQYVLNGNNTFNASVSWDSTNGTWSADFGNMPALTLTLGGQSNPTAPPPLLPLLPHAGDANEDSRVDINDLTIVLSNFGDTGCTWTQGCMDGDPTGTVDINDLTIVLANFGWSATGQDAPAFVPEPSTLVLLGAGLVSLVAWAWRRQVGK
jgi:hypothetical protein